ncbi:hypothetical protein O181_049162 [Austropuccinia psidii MF-1]|uniref:Uncharacterized protein n=1 Tax=Austropuccinia psidii MF-1 TaxID=1389203 RepID=A0A9Q3E1A0_9BASI|nr:hypothetical protein [Austropuccinia psidii MF-1]
MSELPESISLIILDSSESPSLFVTHNTRYMVELPSFPSFEWDFLLVDTPKGEDLILGFDFLNHFDPSIYRRTPSFPYSVHITSLSYHASSLSSKDEVFKEIQDGGEDNSVSSLHPFFLS